MSTIYSFAISPGSSEIVVPHDAQLLSVQMQNGIPFLHVLADPSLRHIRIVLGVYMTGQWIPQSPGKYIGTFQMDGGQSAYHLFEMARESHMGMRNIAS